MADSWVVVAGPSDQDVYTDGNYIEPAGKTNEPFEVEVGAQTFALLDQSTNPPTVIAKTDATITPHTKSDPQKVELWPPGKRPASTPKPRRTRTTAGGRP